MWGSHGLMQAEGVGGGVWEIPDRESDEGWQELDGNTHKQTLTYKNKTQICAKVQKGVDIRTPTDTYACRCT